MSRRKLALAVTGAAVVAGAAGWAFGTLFAPASGKELRRRLAWRTEEQWRSMARSSERLLDRVAARAAAEIEELKKRAAAMKEA